MKLSRREFFRRSGLTLLGLSGMKSQGVLFRGGLKGAFAQEEASEDIRWGMVVDTKRCRDGCEDCINACHRGHNVPDFPCKKDEVKWVWNEPYDKVFPHEQAESAEGALRSSHVMVLCNHCDNPPCVRACPTKATFKREDGIVMMDYHRCFGCRYCMAACPYGARSFNWREPRPFIKEFNREFPTRTKGVVEKCNFCAERLAYDLSSVPLCVEACKNQALIFGNLHDVHSKVGEALRSTHTIRRHPHLGTGPQIYYVV